MIFLCVCRAGLHLDLFRTTQDLRSEICRHGCGGFDRVVEQYVRGFRRVRARAVLAAFELAARDPEIPGLDIVCGLKAAQEVWDARRARSVR